MAIKVRYNGLEIDGNLLPLFSGSFHYWLSDREDWSAIFDQIKALGFGVVESAVPWSVHETADGGFDFGRQDPRKDLDAWLSLASQKGLKVLLNPGPCVDAGLGTWGYPSRLVHDGDLAAQDAEGGRTAFEGTEPPQWVPSLADERLYEAFDLYLAELAPLLQKHLHPHGAVVAVQVDQSLALAGPDFSPASLKLWGHFLDLKYRSLAPLNKAWGRKQKGFDEAEAPRQPAAAGATPEEFRRCQDWVEYQEYRALWSLNRLSGLYRSRGLATVPLLHAFQDAWTTPANLPEIEADGGIDVCGLSAYSFAETALPCVDQARYLANSSNLAYFSACAAGTRALSPRPRDRHDEASTLLAPLMGGAKGVNFRMLVERDGWLGSPVDGRGQRQEDPADLFQRFCAFVRDTEWPRSSPQNQGLLLLSREAQWKTAAQDPAGDGCAAFFAAARSFVAESHFSFGLADGAVAGDRLKRHAFVIATLPKNLEEGTARRLRAYVEEGGQLILGPAWPSENGRGEPLKAWEDLKPEAAKALALGDGKLLWMEQFDPKAAAAQLRKGRVFAEITLSDPSLELALHKCAGRSLLFVRNPHAQERRANVQREGKFVLKPLWASDKFLGGVEEREVLLAPHEIKVWDVLAVN
jgi:beta-galactosidase